MATIEGIAIEMPVKDYQKLVTILETFPRIVAQKEYPFFASVYDEDAGVFTDYGQNKASTTWANLYFMQLCNIAHRFMMRAKFPPEYKECKTNEEYENLILKVVIPDICGAALMQLLTSIPPEVQKEGWTGAANSYYDSDGHYENKPKEEIIEEFIQRNTVTLSWVRDMRKRIMGDYPYKRKTVTLGCGIVREEE